MKILSFESSCDETSAAVTEHEEGKHVILSNIVASQISIHALYGGVVPEIASRAHSEAISKITYEALKDAKTNLSEIDAIAVTNTPGLIGALLVGVNFAKSLAISNDIPLIPVNHILGHIAASFYLENAPEPPYIALVASGGHTSIIKVESHTKHETIGRTRDDAIGESFDKIARVMGIPYPGGAEMDRLASLGNQNAFEFPSAAISDGSLDFSFSGLKTNAINLIHYFEQKDLEYSREDIAASYTKSVVKSVVKKLSVAIEQTAYSKIVLAGGVAANSHLRNGLEQFCRNKNIEFYVPDKKLCGDNAAMIGAQAYYDYISGKVAGADLNAFPS